MRSAKSGELNMANRIAGQSPLKTARMAGFYYLIFIVTFASSTFGKSPAEAPGRTLTYERMTYPLYPVMFIAEFGLALWLLIKGVKMEALDAPK